jgi:hypothetical protein
MTNIGNVHGMRWRHARHMKVLALSCLIAAFEAGEVHADDQPAFDLICSTQEGQSIQFRFDLQQKKWCMGECESVWPINELGDGMIKLSVRTIDDSDSWDINIDRYKSQFWMVHLGHGSKPQAWGQCEAENFSGFPNKKF